MKAEKLCISFGGLAAVKDVSFVIPEGKIVSLIGPNGAGKTTIFNIITGFYKGDSGTVQLCGELINNVKSEHRINLGMARTFQNVRLFRQLSVLDNAMIGGRRHMPYTVLDAMLCTKKLKAGEKAAREECCALLERVGLLEEKDNICENLPYGKQKKLEIVRALASRPKLLLLDEPAAGLNPQETKELSDFVRELLRDGGLTIFLIEHDMSMVMEISDYVYVVNQGKLLAEGRPEIVKNNQDVIDAYIGRGGIKKLADSK